jgi:aminopeptidase N
MAIEHRLHQHACCGLRAALPRAFALPGSSRHFERDRPFLVDHLFAELWLDLPKKSVKGRAVLTLRRVDEGATFVELDAVGFDLDTVKLATGKGAFHLVDASYDGDVLTVPVPLTATEVRVEVSYTATPRRGMYFLAPDEHVRDRPIQVWTQCQDEDARHFLPCIDKPHVKQTSELVLHVPEAFTTLSNGALIADTSRDGQRVCHWKMDQVHSTYLLSVVAGRFDVIEEETPGGLPLSYLFPEGRREDAERTFSQTAAMVEHFGKLTGVAFPWNKYAQVVVADFIFGGMENTTATTLYEHTLLDAKAAIDLTSDDLIAHELAHQWFGDYVTCRDWSHGWLNEGFATHFEQVERERRHGKDEYFYGIRADQQSYLSEAKGRYQRPIVCQDYEAPIDLFDRHLYEKGGLVLHLLRQELSDAVFFRGVGNYLTRHAHGLVETRDLLRALEETSGKSLEGFFDQWVFRPGHPDLAVEVRLDNAARQVVVSVKQTQKRAPAGTVAANPAAGVGLFSLTLELCLVDPDGNVRREALPVREAEATFALPLSAGERVAHVEVDPRHRVVGEVSVEAPLDMLRHQLLHGQTARARWRAAESLGKRTDLRTLRLLGEVLADESAFWGLRVIVAETLGATKLDDAFETLRKHVQTTQPKVRRAVASALGKFRTPEAARLLAPLALQDESYAVEAEAARALGATRQQSAFDTLVELLDRDSWSDVVRTGAIEGLAALRDERAVPHLMARTRYGVPTRARRAAIRGLAKLSTDRKTREHLEDLLEDDDPHLRIDVALALAELGDTKSRGALSRALHRDLDGRVRRRLQEVLRDLSGSSKEEQRRLSDELDSVKKELIELRARFAKLEARGPAGETRPGPSPASAAGRQIARVGGGAGRASPRPEKTTKPKKASPSGAGTTVKSSKIGPPAAKKSVAAAAKPKKR